MNKMMILLAGGATLVLAACVQRSPPPPPPAAFDSMDAFQKELANRASKALGTAEDFNIVVTQAYYPIGTLMRTGSTIPIDYTACLPSIAPPSSATPSLFPSYELSSGLAIDFGLDNEVISKLVDFGITVKETDTVNVSVKAPKIQSLADTDLTKLLSKADCKGAVPASSAWLVRGYLIGQRTFVLKTDKASNVKGKLEKLASFNVSVGSGNASLDITDTGEIGFLQIVSQVFVNPGITKQETLSVIKPQVTANAGLVFVQRDRVDKSNNAELIVTALSAGKFGVAKAIERIDSSRMPKVAQVRYFNDADKTLAERALAQLQLQFPSATIVRIGLPAPSGQLEVWLPRV